MDNNEVTMKVTIPKIILEAKDEKLKSLLNKTSLEVYQRAKDELSKKDLEEIGAVAISTLVCTRVLYHATKDESLKDIVDVIKRMIQTGSDKDFYIELNFK